MNPTLKWILIAGGLGYLFFHEQITAALTPAGSSNDPGLYIPPTGGSSTPTTTNAGTTPATDATSTKARILQAAQSDAVYLANNGRMSPYQWDYYYKLVRGIDGKDPAALGISDPNILLSLDEFWAAATNAGMSGVRGIGRTVRRAPFRAWGV